MTSFSFESKDGKKIYTYKWENLNIIPKGIIQISHGMAETAARYKEFADILAENGFIVYANDHRGHGQNVNDIGELGYLGSGDGFLKLIDDMGILTDIIQNDYPDLPIILFGHSMGSFASQRYIMDYENKIDGLILSGSNGAQGGILNFGKLIATFESKLRGEKAKSNLLNKLSFGSYNSKFKPNRTEFDWLSRDENEVDKYINNPLCGSVFPASFYRDFFKTLQYIEDKNNLSKIPKDLPIYIISGGDDPVGNFGVGVKNLYERYKNAGTKYVDYKIYIDARHELLNEINRDEVILDIINWIDKIVLK